MKDLEVKLTKIDDSKNKSSMYDTPARRLGICILVVSVMFVVLFFVIGTLKMKVCACICSPLVIVYAVCGYFKEKRNEKRFSEEKSAYTKGRRVDNEKWKNDYIEYKMNVGFEAVKESSMKKELLKRFRSREALEFGALFVFLTAAGFCSVLSLHDLSLGKRILFFIGIPLFCLLAFDQFYEYFGGPVYKFYRGSYDFPRIESSFMNGKMLTCKHVGVNLGSDYIVWYDRRHVYIIDLDMVENVKRKVVRVKVFEDSLYKDDEYRYYAVFEVRLPSTGRLVEPCIPLEDFQVEMLIEEISKRKYIGIRKIEIAEDSETEIVT